MTIDEAIEILTRYTGGGNPWSLTDLTEASKLGIEALKVIRDVRPTEYGAIDEPLLGETKASPNGEPLSSPQQAGGYPAEGK